MFQNKNVVTNVSNIENNTCENWRIRKSLMYKHYEERFNCKKGNSRIQLFKTRETDGKNKIGVTN